MASTAQAHARRLVLDDLPREVLDRILVFLTPRDLASLNATARLFHAAPPGGCSAVERALRERACARGHERALPATLPSGVRTWTAELLARERVLELACSHSPPVAAGVGFSACVDAEGGLHTCGEEEVPDQSEPESDDEDEDGEPTGAYRAPAAISHSGMPAVLVPTHVASLSAVRVCAVAAGRAHLLALSEAGAVYGCGDNGYGQLGLGDEEEQRSFTLVGLPASEPVVCIAAADAHSLALTAAGCAYSWGNNGFGQLGHGDGQHQHTPRRIEALAGVRAVHVSAGGGHSLVVDSEGTVYSFGFGEDAALGHGDTREQLSPRRLDALAGVRIVRACAGGLSSAVLGADGSVHTFGSNRYGQLGLGHGGAALEAPTRAGALAHTRVVHCAMGDYHSLFVSADGSVYACGKRSAALGLGMSVAEQDEPTQRVDAPVLVETAWCARVC